MVQPITHTYKGASEIVFHTNEKEQLSVTIETEDLYMRSIKEEDINDYVDLFGDAEVMKNYAEGKPREKEKVINRVIDWIKRWEVEKDPYGALAVFEKKSNKFVGHIILGHGDLPGESELAGLENEVFWNNGYAKQAAKAIMEYAKATIKEKYILEGETLNKIIATTLPTNEAAVKLLNSIGKFEKEVEKFGKMRLQYAIKV